MGSWCGELHEVTDQRSPSMKRIAGVLAVVILFVWSVMHFTKKPGDPSMEQMAEKFGRSARDRMAKKHQQPAPTGLQIAETSTEATTTQAGATDAASMMANLQSQATPEEKAKARVTAMLTAWQNGAKLKAAAIWAHGLDPNAMDDLHAASDGFESFLREKGLGDRIGSFEIVSSIRRVNGQEQYTTLDVALDGVTYHMGVPDSASAISWSF